MGSDALRFVGGERRVVDMNEGVEGYCVWSSVCCLSPTEVRVGSSVITRLDRR